MSSETITLERCGAVAVVTLNRPERRNALDEAMWLRLREVADEIAGDSYRAVVLTGAGDSAFCAGMDLNPDNPQIARLVSAVQTHDRAPVEAMLSQLHSVLDPLFALPIPLIAAINGVAYGGGAEIAARCDLRVMADSATVCFSEVKLGLMPDLGGGVALTRLLGPGRAADLILTARRFHGQEALELGFANRVVAAESCLESAVEMAQAISANGPRAVRAALAIIRQTGGRDLKDAIATEVEAAIQLIASGECSHGISAFLSRTTPSFPDASD